MVASNDGLFWSQLINYLRDVKCPDLEWISDEFYTLEKRTEVRIKDYLGEAIITPFQTKTT